MTEQEKTDLRIKAAKAIGLREISITEAYGLDDEILRKCFWVYEGDVITTGESRHSVRPWNPLTSADDCLSLLVATLRREWIIVSTGYNDEYNRCNPNVAWVALKRSSLDIVQHGDSPDARLALLESITKACCSAWEAEQEGRE